jgi:hypothetical protein
MERSNIAFGAQPGISERSDYSQRVRQAIDLCAVLSVFHEPAYHAATAAETKLLVLCKLVEGLSVAESTLGEFESPDANSSNHLEKEMSALRYNMAQTQHLFHAVTIICDRFLLNTAQLAQDMTQALHSLRDYSSREDLAARESQERLLGQLLRGVGGMSLRCLSPSHTHPFYRYQPWSIDVGAIISFPDLCSPLTLDLHLYLMCRRLRRSSHLVSLIMRWSVNVYQYLYTFVGFA